MPLKDNLREKLLADEDVQGTPSPRRNEGVAEVRIVEFPNLWGEIRMRGKDSKKYPG